MTDVHRYGPWAVILGGSEGVGASFAVQLAADGFNLVLVARKPEPLEATAAAARALGVDVRALALDLTSGTAVESLFEATADVEVGLLICNAGANSYGHSFLEGDLAGFGSVIDLNVTTPLACAQHYGRVMKERRRGGIVFIGSLSGYLGSLRESVYGAAKAFGRIFAEGLWLELREYDVDVLEFVLGVTRTPAMERVGLNFDIPGLRVGEPDEVARQALASLADGPVVIADGNERVAQMRGGLDRAKLVLGSHEAMKHLIPHT